MSQFITISVKQGAKLLRQLPPHVAVGLPQPPPSSLLANKHLSAEERRRLVASGEAASLPAYLNSLRLPSLVYKNRATASKLSPFVCCGSRLTAGTE